MAERTQSPVHAATRAYLAAWARLKANEQQDDDETVNAAGEAELEAAQALVDAPCADDAEFIYELREIMPIVVFDEGGLPPIAERFGQLILAVAAYLEQRRWAQSPSPGRRAEGRPKGRPSFLCVRTDGRGNLRSPNRSRQNRNREALHSLICPSLSSSPRSPGAMRYIEPARASSKSTEL